MAHYEKNVMKTHKMKRIITIHKRIFLFW